METTGQSPPSAGPQPLGQFLQSRAFFPRDLYRILWEITAAVEALHRAGSVAKGVQAYRVQIEANGHAALSESDEASEAMMAGLQAPEVMAGGPFTPAADIFSLGLLFFEILCGVHAFAGPSGELARRLPPSFPPDAAPLLPAEFRQLILDMTREAPEARIPSLAAVMERFEAALEAPDPQLPPDPWPAGVSVGNLEELNGVFARASCRSPIEIAYLMDHLLRQVGPGQTGPFRIDPAEVAQAIAGLRAETMPSAAVPAPAPPAAEVPAKKTSGGRQRTEHTVEIDAQALQEELALAKEEKARAAALPAGKPLPAGPVELEGGLRTAESLKPVPKGPSFDNVEFTVETSRKGLLPVLLGAALLGSGFFVYFFVLSEMGVALRLDECQESATGFMPEITFSDSVARGGLEQIKAPGLVCDAGWSCRDGQSGRLIFSFQRATAFPETDYGDAYLDASAGLLLLKGSGKVALRARPYSTTPEGHIVLSMTECLFSTSPKRFAFRLYKLLDRFR